MPGHARPCRRLQPASTVITAIEEYSTRSSTIYEVPTIHEVPTESSPGHSCGLGYGSEALGWVNCDGQARRGSGT